MRIAKNDPSGAHAAVGGELQRSTWLLPDVIDRLTNADAHGGNRVLRAHFGSGVFEAKVPRFPRSRGLWRVAVPELERRVSLVEIEFDTQLRHGWPGPWFARALGVMVERHAIARCCQRTVSESMLTENIAVLKPHMLEAERLIAGEAIRVRDELTTIDGRGVLLWHAENSLDVPVAFHAATWIGDTSLKNPALRKLVARARVTGALLTHRGGSLGCE